MRPFQKIFILALAITLLGTGCAAFTGGNVKKGTLHNGTTLIVKREKGNPLVGITCFMRFGPREESAENAGITHLALNVARKATLHLISKSLAEKLEELGASVTSDVGADYASLSLSVPQSHFEEAHALFIDILTSPLFATSEVEAERTRQLAGIKSQRDDPFDHAYEKLQKNLYGNHSYAFPATGTLSSVKKIGRKDLLNWFHSLSAPNQFVISATGDVPFGKLARIYEKEFPKRTDTVLLNAHIAKFLKPTSDVIQKPTESAWIIHGYPFGATDHKSYASMKVLGSLLGGGMSSRLFDALREEKGLTYSTGAFFPTRALGSHLGIYASTPKENVKRVSNALLWLLRKWRKEEFPEEEVKVAVQKVIGDHLRAHQSTQSRSWYLGWYEILGWGPEFDKEYLKYVRDVRAGDIQALLKSLPVQPHEVIVAPNQKLN